MLLATIVRPPPFVVDESKVLFVLLLMNETPKSLDEKVGIEKPLIDIY